MKKLTTILGLLAVAAAAAPSVCAFDGIPHVPDTGATFTLLTLSFLGLGVARRVFGK